MAEKKLSADDIVFPALLRRARSTYGGAIRDALAEAGFDDIPKNGIYVIGAISRMGAPMATIIRQLGVSKQAAGQLVDALVLRGYLERAVDDEDRRRLTVALTERGRAAKPGLKTGICGEHGGDPKSIEFFENIDLDYVSCSPFRVPVARLSAAQATIRRRAKSKS